MTEEEARNYRINPFDLTKVWPHGDFPLQDVGILELNRNPENFYAEVNRLPSIPSISSTASAFRPTRCFKDGCFPTATHSAIAWA